MRDSRYKSLILLVTNVKDSRFIYSQDTTCSARRIYSSFSGVCFCRCEKLILPALGPKFFPLAICSAATPFSCSYSYSLLSSPVYSTLIVCRTLIVCHEEAEQGGIIFDLSARHFSLVCLLKKEWVPVGLTSCLLSVSPSFSPSLPPSSLPLFYLTLRRGLQPAASLRACVSYVL